MSDGRKYYCLCESNCKFETMTKEQILAAIAQAIETGSVGDVDTGFVTKLKDMNSGSALTVWIGTRAQYNAIAEKVNNCLYIITDDTTGDDLAKACQQALADANETWGHVVELCEEAVRESTDAMVNSEQAISAAAEAADAASAVDVTGDISFTLDATATITTADTCYISAKRFCYVRSLGIVFFNFSLSFNRAAAGNKFVYDQSGKFKRDISAFQYMPIQSADKRLFAKLTRDGFVVDVLENVTGEACVEFSGWYFSNGTGGEV